MNKNKKIFSLSILLIFAGIFSAFKYYQHIQQEKLYRAVKKEAFRSLQSLIDEKMPFIVKKNEFISPHFKELIEAVSKVETISTIVDDDHRKYFEVQILLPNDETMLKIAEKYNVALNAGKDLSKVEYSDKIDFFILKTKVELKLENNQWTTSELDRP